MLKKLLNQATIALTITAKGPVLIKSGIEGGADPSVPDMQFVRTGEQVYIPGSSLKGVFRSYAEKSARTVEARCCNPFDDDFCGKQLENNKRGDEVYKRSCRICKLFGSTAMASRIKFNDAYPLDGQTLMTETRTGVAIDRILGSVAHGPFDFEVVTQGAFATTIQLRNFEVWQVGLLALVLRDLEEGLIPIGFGKSRGLGDVEARVTLFKVRYPSVVDEVRTNASHRLYGLGKLATEQERQAYWAADERPGEALGEDLVAFESAAQSSEEGLGVSVEFGDVVRQEAFGKCVNERWREVVHHDRSHQQDRARRS